MRHSLRDSLLIIFLLSASTTLSQDGLFSVGAYGSMMVPTGALSRRFVAAPGGSLFFFVNRGTPQWGGGLEYFKYSRLADNLAINRPVTDTVNAVPQKTFYQVPIPRITMSLEIMGAALQARYEVVRVGDFIINAGFGAGIYHWTFNRNEYRDSIKVQTPHGERTAAVLSVPALEQQDWSGGFNFGADVGFKLFDPVSLNAGARYKLIIGELWPTLALDLESVSTFQMLDIRAGVSVDF